MNVLHAVLPRDQTLNVDVQLIPDGHDGFIVLLVPVEQSMSKFSKCFFKIATAFLYVFVCVHTCWTG